MSQERPSINSIIAHWYDRNDSKIDFKDRKDLLRELFLDCVYHGYGRMDVWLNRDKIKGCCIGKSRKGPAGDKAWKKMVDKDFAVVIDLVFDPITPRTEDVKVTRQSASDDELAAQPAPTPEEIETTPEESEDDDIEYQSSLDAGYVIPPELDRSLLPQIETTPIMSEEDFLATIERENNE